MYKIDEFYVPGHSRDRKNVVTIYLEDLDGRIDLRARSSLLPPCIKGWECQVCVYGDFYGYYKVVCTS